MTDVLQTVWDALERCGCDPHGAPWKGTARCPAHEDRSPSLSIGVGADGRALVYCHAGCSAEQIVAAVGLTMADLFPAGHHRRPLRRIAGERAASDLVLGCLRELAIDYRPARSEGMWVAVRCPACGAGDDEHPLWIHTDDRGRVGVSCFNGCDQAAVLNALAGVIQ